MEMWKKLHKEELYNLCSSPNIIRVIMLTRKTTDGRVKCVRDFNDTHKILFGKTEANGALGRSRCKWEDNTILKYILNN
jgi:hypothetical protein